MSTQPRVKSLRHADRQILEQLRDSPPTYMALVANRLGMPTGYVDRRWTVLEEHGFIEPVTNEAIYRVTDAGEGYLDRTAPAATAADTDD